MIFPEIFIKASSEYCNFEKHKPAPMFRKKFSIKTLEKAAHITISGLGFYDLYLNGKRLTKGILAPYLSNPDQVIYYDKYDVTQLLKEGENVIGIILGNGLQNPFAGSWWEFEKASWMGPPMLAMSLSIDEQILFETDESFKVSNSPIIFDEYRCGEHYDARLYKIGWCDVNFDDSNWQNAMVAKKPNGVAKFCIAEAVCLQDELKPLSITEQENGFLYDFGVNLAGVTKLKINGYNGQKVTLTHGERLVNDVLDNSNMGLVRLDYLQKTIYICRGEETEEFTPCFTFYGFQYVFVEGINKEQATNELLTFMVYNSDLKEIGGFECSDEIANELQLMTRRSTLSNFFYFPMDCPHREKNGWTADAALSAEHTLLNLTAENSYREWLVNIRAAQKETGQIPCIVPTADWGYDWGSGPVWDSVLVELPYQTYIYRGDKVILQENAQAIFKYLKYLKTLINEDGLIEKGLGDWCEVGKIDFEDYSSPLIFTCSVISMDICRKSAFIFETLNMQEEKAFALEISTMLKTAIREKLVDLSTMIAIGNCQTSQAMAIYYDVFNHDEKQKAFEKLLEIIKRDYNNMQVGVLGGRVLFHVLAEFGEIDLAYEMITKKEYPSYGNWIERGATTLWEEFQPEGGREISKNHHFWGDISSFFIKRICGLNYTMGAVKISPKFPNKLEYAKAFHITPYGKIEVEWKRLKENISISIVTPKEVKVDIDINQKKIKVNSIV
jgi:alpha-L-rhamnosidase